jgi:uncharacterized spore protein YtfJ
MPNIDELLSGARDAVTVRRVYGEPIERNGVTIVPAAAVRGWGGGGGDSAGRGGGGLGYTVAGRPVGVYVLENGRARWRPAVDVNRLLLLLAALVFVHGLQRR